MKLFYVTLLAGAVGTMPMSLTECGSTSTDLDEDGYTVESGQDCDDSDPSVHVDAPELCDGQDNDCDGEIDEEGAPQTYYLDQDGDGYGTGAAQSGCTVPAGYASRSGDCDDQDASIHPGAEEVVGDTTDSNCNTHLDLVTTVAGAGTSGYSGDGGPATAAQLAIPFGVVKDARGNVFVADTSNHRVRRIDANGTITTLAGTGTAGSAGDGGPATQAQLNNPRGLALDKAGNLYIADSSNRKIRKIDSSGVITTVVGTGATGDTGDGGPATQATLGYPYGVVVDGAGSLFVADADNHRVRKVSSSGTISAFAGTGALGSAGDGGAATAAQLRTPRGLAVDGSGNLFIVDSSDYRVRKVASSNGVITTVAGNGSDGFSGDDGPATSASLNDPYGVAVDPFGNLFIADTDNSRVRKVDSAGIIDTVVGTGTAGYSGDGQESGSAKAQVNFPYALCTDPAGDLYIADGKNFRVRYVRW